MPDDAGEQQCYGEKNDGDIQRELEQREPLRQVKIGVVGVRVHVLQGFHVHDGARGAQCGETAGMNAHARALGEQQRHGDEEKQRSPGSLS